MRRMAAGLLLPLAAIALAVAGLRVSVPGGVTALAAVTAGLVIAWALCAAASAQARERTPQWQLAAGAVTASVAAGAARIADRASGGQLHAARAIATVAGLLVIAISVHLLLSLPDGRLYSRVRRVGAVLGYVAAVAAGTALAAAGRGVPAAAGAVAWSLAFLCRAARGPAAVRRRGQPRQGAAAVGGDRRRPGRERCACPPPCCTCSWAGPRRSRRWRRAPRCLSRSACWPGTFPSLARTAVACSCRCWRSPASP